MEKFYFFEKEGHTSQVIKKLSPLFQQPGTTISKIEIDSRGFYICYERTSDKKFLNKTTKHSEILIYNINNGKKPDMVGIFKGQQAKSGNDMGYCTRLSLYCCSGKILQ